MTRAEPDDARITHYLCIGCPLGCRLEVEEGLEGAIVEVRGFSCKRGERFARQESVVHGSRVQRHRYVLSARPARRLVFHI